MKKTIVEMAIYLWKKIELIHSIDYPGSTPGITCWEERRKIFEKFSNFTQLVMGEYEKNGLNSSLPVLMVAKEYLTESLYNQGEKSYEITKFLNEKYKDCGAWWSAGGRGCCATASATAWINPAGEIFAYRLGWSDSMGQNGNSQTFPAAEITSVTDALENFNHFGGECWPDTRYTIFPREDWRVVERKFKAYQEAKKVRLDTEARMAWRIGEPFSFGVTTRGGWYKSSAGLGLGRIVPQHEHDDSGTRLGMMKIMPSMPYGSYQIYVWEYPISLTLAMGEEPHLSMCASSSWCNSQSWWYEKHYQTNLQPGWLFVDGVDVYKGTVEIVNKNKTEQSAASNAKFAEAKAKAIEAGITEIQISQIAKLAGKGKVIATLNLATNMVATQKYEITFVLQMLTNLQGRATSVIGSYAYLVAHAAEIKMSSVKKAVEKAYAWSYLNNLIPNFGAGYFDDAMEALKLAITNKVPFGNGNIGGSESDLALKLKEALEKK